MQKHAKFPEARRFSNRLLVTAQTIEAVWCEPVNQVQSSWQSHADINTVMLATSLLAPHMLRV